MAGNRIPCTCDSLGWVKGWKAKVGLIPRVTGTCSCDLTGSCPVSGDTVNDFITGRKLQECGDEVVG